MGSVLSKEQCATSSSLQWSFPEELKWLSVLHPNDEIEYFNKKDWIKARLKHLRWKVVQCDSEKIPFDESSLNWVICIETVERKKISWEINCDSEKLPIRPVSLDYVFWKSKSKCYKMGKWGDASNKFSHYIRGLYIFFQ